MLQVSRNEKSSIRGDQSILGVLCFLIGGYIISVWGTFVLWEILRAPVNIMGLVVYASFLGALGFGFIGIGIRLIVR